MEYMKALPDKYFDLAVVDPPYGIGEKFKGGKTGKIQFNSIVEKAWDVAPTDEYFTELFRVSKNQIIWGGNYFNLPPCRGFIIWDKCIGESFTLSSVEFAWTSFDTVAKQFRYVWSGNTYGYPGNVKGTGKPSIRIHPTEKPRELYRWLFQNYAQKGWKILDTHLGSGNSAIVADAMGFEFIGCEVDDEYYVAAVKRYSEAKDLGLFRIAPQGAKGSVGQNTNTLF